MADFQTTLDARAALLLRVIDNGSSLSVYLYLIRLSGGRFSNYTDNSWSVSIDGAGGGGSGTYNISGGNQLLYANTFYPSRSVGARTISVSGSFNDPRGNVAAGSTGGTLSIAGRPSAPTLTVDPWSPTSAQASWTTPADGGSAITGYRIQYATDSGFTSPATLDVGVSSTRELSSLNPGGAYYVKVAAVNAAGVGDYSTTQLVVLVAEIGDLDGWASFGTLPGGLTPIVTGALRRGSIYPLGAYAPVGLLREIQSSGSGSVTAAAHGIQRTFTGLVVGRTYKLNGTALSLRDTTPAGNLYRFAVTGIGSGSNATTSDTTHPQTIPEYTFVATATSHVVQIQLNEAAAWSGAGWFEAVGFYGIALTEIPNASPYRLQDVALEAGLNDHYSVACDTIGAVWWVDSDDVTQFRQVADDSAIRATFTDVRAQGELEYIDLQASYDTRNVVNTLQVNNHGRDAGTGDALDTTYETADDDAVDEWGPRPGSLEWCLYAPPTVTNLFTNPAMSGAFGVVTNLFTNPSMETGNSPWTQASCTANRTTAWSQFGSYSMGLTSPSATDSFMWVALTTVPGQVYTISGYARVNTPLSGSAHARARSIMWYDTNNSSSQGTSSPAANNSNTTTRVSITFTAPSTSTTVRFYIGHTTGTIYWDGLMMTEGPDLYSYFDGDTTDTSEYDHAWTGTAHASTSTKTGLIGGWSALNAVIERSTTQVQSGTYSCRVMMRPGAAGTTGLTNAYTVGSGGIEASKTYTVSVYVYVPTGSADVRLRIAGAGVAATVTGTATTTKDGWVRLSSSFTTAASGAFNIYVENGGTVSGTTFFYVDSAMLNVGAAAEDYFSGSSTDTDLIDYAWTGTTNASTSTKTSTHVQARAAEVIADRSEPAVVVSQITWNAQENPALAAQLDVQDRIRVRFRGTTDDYRIAGMRHKITKTRWLITFDLAA